MKLQEHLANLQRHIDIVREACILMGNRLIEQGRTQIGVGLISRGYKHDASKFNGIEFQFLHHGLDVAQEVLPLVIEHHRVTNDHHPEYWLGIDNMPEIAVYEMVCDWYGRSQEFGTGLKEWITTVAVSKYNIKRRSQVKKWIDNAVKLLLVNSFAEIK